MDRPWLKFWTRDWLDNKELRRCSPLARSTLLDLMCLAHEGTPYGFLADDVGSLADNYMAARCVVSDVEFAEATRELVRHKRLAVSDAGVLFVPRMVNDEVTRIVKSRAGKAGGNPILLKQEDKQEDKQERAKLLKQRSDSDSYSGAGFDFSENRNARAKHEPTPIPDGFDEFSDGWPQLAEPNRAAQMWISVVNAENLGAVIACGARYRASQQWADGKVQELWRWLQAQHDAHWAGRWPAPKLTSSESRAAMDKRIWEDEESA